MTELTKHNISSRTRILGISWSVLSSPLPEWPTISGSRDQIFFKLEKVLPTDENLIMKYQWFYGGCPIYRVTNLRKLSSRQRFAQVMAKPGKVDQTILGEIIEALDQEGVVVLVQGDPKTVGRKKKKSFARKVGVTVTLDSSLIERLDQTGLGRSAYINEVLSNHFGSIDRKVS